METMLDLFKGDAFGLISMTNEVNTAPYSDGELKDICRFEFYSSVAAGYKDVKTTTDASLDRRLYTALTRSTK